MICLIDILIFIVCGLLFDGGLISAGVIVAALTYAQAFTDPMVEILYDMNMLNSSKDVVKDLEDFFEYQPAASVLRSPEHTIEIRGAEIEYGSKKIQYRVTFDISKKYVLRGASGTGKSTLLNILADRIFYEGALYIDGHEAGIDENDLFYLSQNQHVFAENFNRNVTLFQSYKLEQQNLDNQMKGISLYEQVKQTQNGTLLSGGEQQLLKICRTLIQNKKILLLDEPFSAMDQDTRNQVLHLLNESNAMVILVTHNYNPHDYEGWEEILMEDIANAG